MNELSLDRYITLVSVTTNEKIMDWCVKKWGLGNSCIAFYYKALLNPCIEYQFAKSPG